MIKTQAVTNIETATPKKAFVAEQPQMPNDIKAERIAIRHGGRAATMIPKAIKPVLKSVVLVYSHEKTDCSVKLFVFSQTNHETELLILNY